MTYRGHKVLTTLIRAYFSPLHTTAQRFIYAGSADGSVYIYGEAMHLDLGLIVHTGVGVGVTWGWREGLEWVHSWSLGEPLDGSIALLKGACLCARASFVAGILCGQSTQTLHTSVH